MAEEEAESKFECPSKIEIVPTSEIFSFDFTFKMSGTENANVDYTTKPITLTTKPFKYDILAINSKNKGINDPISKHWPLIETWKTTNITKKIKIFGKTYKIKIPIPKPTQTFYEVYTLKQKAQITFFTIPSFKFKINSSLNWAGSIDNTFSISCEKPGTCLLSTDTAALIDGYYNDTKKILEMTNASDRTTRISTMLSDPKFYLLSTSTALLTYLLRDGLAANYTINNASGKLNWTMNTFYIEFGDLKITIPKFQIKLDFPDLLKDPITGETHPVTVSGSPESGLTVTVQLLEVPNGDFFGLMIDSLQNTLELAKKATGTDYDADYVKELEDILAQLQNADDLVTKWIQKYLGISFTIVFSFVFCPAGMSNEPPTPFYLKVELDLDINPYKILDELFDAAEAIEESLSEFENDFMNDIKEISPSFAHPLEKMLQGALNTLNKELKTATEKGQKMIDNKYVNKIYTIALATYVPIEPPA
jgi:hypothetical protein